jgi:N-acetylglucosaminyldiphosphoundecaprenol N-acetyl-beta-D-mannosaminyltransferase
MQVNICGIGVDRYSLDEAVNDIVNHVEFNKSPEYVVTPNAHHIVLLQRDAKFRQIYQQARWVVPDGVSLLWAAKFLNTPLAGRVNGTDLFEQLCAVSAERNLKVFLLGGRPGAAEQAARVLKARYPALKIVGTYCPPYGFHLDLEEQEKINSIIQEAAPDLLFVGLGAPKQEYWIYNNCQKVNVPVSLGIGVSFELVSDMVKRAPKWMQKSGLEWLFRLLMEPGRLWQRYLVTNVAFIVLVLRQKLKLLLA